MTTIIQMQTSGAPSVLRSATAPVGEPGPGQVRLRQEAVGVNYVDTMVRDGRFPVPLPAIPGFEGAGTVESVGPDAGVLRAGQRAAYFFAAGAYAGERLVDAADLILMPDDIDAVHAAAFLAKGLTAWMGLRVLHSLKAGDVILVQGASGNVGAILSRWARALGAVVIGVAGSRARLDKVKAGASHALAADDPDFAASLRAIAPNGVDVVYDFVGAAVRDLSQAALRDGGTLVAIGAASGRPDFDQPLLARRRIVLRTGSTAQAISPARKAEAAAELFQAMRDGLFADLPVVRYALDDAAQAHEDIGQRRLDGLAVLIPHGAGDGDGEDADTTPASIARTFFAHWSAGRIDAALAMLAPDVLYDNVPFPDVHGRDATAAFHRDFGIGTDFTVDWQVTHLAAAGKVVLNERRDIFRHKDGGTISLPVMGTLTIEDGQITLWRDYFDPADFERQLAALPRRRPECVPLSA